MVQYPFPIPNGSPFPISNIPWGIFYTEDDLDPRPGTAVGDHVLDLRILIQGGLPVDESVKEALESPSLNAFAALAPSVRNSLRKAIQEALRDESSIIYREDTGVIAADQATMHVPMKIGGFTDFMCSLEHVQTMGHMAGYSEVPQNFFDLPAAYNGRASSVIVSGQNITRPHGIIPGPDGATYAPSQKFDFELEMGVFISNPIKYGEPTPASRARDHVFGFVILNDWSARDIQFYEMAPLGPFNGKATATSISPWIVTLEALEEAGALLTTEDLGLRGGKNTAIPFLHCPDDVAVQVSTSLSRNGVTEVLLGKSDLKHLHWSPFQMVAHHSSSGCGLETGDLLGTGTLSSSTEQIKEFGSDHDPIRRSGCLAELVLGGTRPFTLSDESEIVWLEDGDTVTMEGWAGSGDRVIGFALIHNGLVFTSGKIGVDANIGVLVSDGVAEQTMSCSNIMMRSADAAMDITMIPNPKPARVCVTVSELDKGAKMRTLLLLGGMTPDVTALYYNIINKVVRIKLGDRASAPLYLYSANLEEMIQHAMKGDWDEFAKVYKTPIRSLSDRVDGIAICAILAHKVAKKLFDDSSAARVPLFHIADCLALHIINNHPSAKKLGLLGPKISMLDSDDPDFFVAMLQKAGFEILIPETPEDIEEVNRGMLQEVARGVASVTDSTKNMFVQQAKKLIDRGAQGIILGSTDLGFVLRQEDVGDIPLFEPAAIHAQELGIWICEGDEDQSSYRFSVTCTYPELADRRRLTARRDSVRTERIRRVSDAAPVTPESTELNVGAVTSPSVTPRIHSAGLVSVGPPQTEHAVLRSADASLDDLPPRAIGLALLDIYFERFLRKSRFQPPRLGSHAISPELAAFATYAVYGDAWAESARREAWLLTDLPTVQVVQALSCLNLYWFATRDLGRARINAEAYAKNAWEEACNVPLPVASDGFASEGSVAHRYCMNFEWNPEALNEEPNIPSSIMAEHMRLMGVWVKIQLINRDKRESPDVTRILHLSSLAKEIYESSHFPAYVTGNEGVGRDIARLLGLHSLYHLCQIVLLCPLVSLFSGQRGIAREKTQSHAQTIAKHAIHHGHLIRDYIAKRQDISKLSSHIGFASFVSTSIILTLLRSRARRHHDDGHTRDHVSQALVTLIQDSIDILSILETFWEHLEPMTRSLQHAAAQILGPVDLIDQSAAGAESRGIEVPMTGVNSPAREEDVITTTYIESPEYPSAQNSARAFTNAHFGVTDRAMEHATQIMDETPDWHHNNLFEWCQTEGLLDIGDDSLDIGASVDWNMDLDLLTGFSSQMA
ncbi:unnamed protein product [Fusarium fujikuroi]|uniref:fumarylacetoacetase n=1 Tax=Fusarium fujikuroi TaxID=5127 RepID=A0A9Q9RFY2_FUSFU|nr:unnamed protein product [Fusarium fujikuroi]